MLAVTSLILLLLFQSIHHQTEATKCKPLSYFKVDSLRCQCSSDGTKYFCIEMYDPRFRIFGRSDST
ncbi:hypothetical protein QE152_g5616 [Popillia japonica]|uniref:Uncharacterized protein n=1 Tax=Popillia japonica TaxID=7064 RepID=A0AAW1MQN8_POPJA